MSVREETGCDNPNCPSCYPLTKASIGEPFLSKAAAAAKLGAGRSYPYKPGGRQGTYTNAAPQHLPADAKERKGIPIATGVVDYFPDALVAVARLSQIGNDQHNPGQPLHWSRGKSTDHRDTLLRHFTDAGTLDTDGVRHSAKVAWRALAILQLEIEAARLTDLASPVGQSEYKVAVDLPSGAPTSEWFYGGEKAKKAFVGLPPDSLVEYQGAPWGVARKTTIAKHREFRFDDPSARYRVVAP